MDEELEKTILRRLGNLETHIINLIHPIQSICSVLTRKEDLYELISLLKKPLSIDDSRLRNLIREFHNVMEKFDENIKKLNFVQTFGEIKFIGKKLHQIEADIAEIKKDGVKKKVDLNFSCDGYELVKKEIEHVISKNPDDLLNEVLSTLPEREQKIIIHRLGLFGIVPKKTYVALGKFLGISGGISSQIYRKALRKLRHPTRSVMVKNCMNKKLIEEVFGKEEHHLLHE